MIRKDIWTIRLDWLKILNKLNIDSINDIPEFKKEKVIKKITRIYGTETLLELENDELDNIVLNELKDAMRKELSLSERKQEKFENEMRSKFVPFKNGGILKIDPRDFEDLDPNSDPEEILKFFYKKFMGSGDQNDNEDDDDKDKYTEDSSGYYI